jgi:hypothetical protein
VFFASLDPTNIIRVQVGFFGEPFLAQMQPLPFFADGVTKNNAIIRRRHSLKGKQGSS